MSRPSRPLLKAVRSSTVRDATAVGMDVDFDMSAPGDEEPTSPVQRKKSSNTNNGAAAGSAAGRIPFW